MAIKLPLEDLVAAENQAGLTFTIELAGDVFGLTLRYNDRDGRYYLSVADEDEVSIIDGVKVVLDVPLISRVADVRRPKGDFLAVDVGAQAEPTRGTLGAGVDLLFVSWDESRA